MPEDTRVFVPQPWKMIAEGKGWNNQHKTSGKPQVKIVCTTEAGETVDVVVYSDHINHEALAGAEIVVTNLPDRKGDAKTAWYNKRKEGGYGVWAFDQSVTVDGKPFKAWAGANGVSSSAVGPPTGAFPFTPLTSPGRSPKATLKHNEWWLRLEKELAEAGIEDIKALSEDNRVKLGISASIADSRGEKESPPPGHDGLGDTDGTIPF